MVSWPQGAVIAPPPLFPDFFLAFLHIFQNFPCALGKKRIFFSFLRVYVCVKAKLKLISFFSPFFAPLTAKLAWLISTHKKAEN